jgi:hypothetical protein
MNKYENNIPVALFLWKRTENLRQILEGIKAYSPKILIVIIDGPAKADDTEPNREIIKIIEVFSASVRFSVLVKTSDLNLGLKKSFVEGFLYIFSYTDEVIVLEDDTIPHPSFFYFCEYYLNTLRNDRHVIAINGSLRVSPALKDKLGIRTDFFNRVFCPWGWATWKTKFLSVYNPNIRSFGIKDIIHAVYLLRNLELFRKRYSVLQRIVDGTLSTWDVQLQWNIIMGNKWVLTCQHNLITNVGLDDSAATQTADFYGLLNRPFSGQFSVAQAPKKRSIKTITDYDCEVFQCNTNFYYVKSWFLRYSKKWIKQFIRRGRRILFIIPAYLSSVKKGRRILETLAGMYLSCRLFLHQKKLINLFLVGEQRCGTTSFHKWLENHPDFVVGVRKEKQMFNNGFNFNDNNTLKPGTNLTDVYIKGPLSKVFKGKYFVDITPDYVFNPESLLRIKRYNPDTRIIYLIRNPIDRFVSSYGFYFHTSKYLSPFFEFDPDGRRMKDFYYRHPDLSFAEYFEMETGTQPIFKSLPRGLYFKNIQRILSHFSSDQLHIVVFENLVNPAVYNQEIDQIARFLKVKPFLHPFPHFHSSEKKSLVITIDQNRFLNDYYSDDVQALREVYLPSLPWDN